MLRWYEGAWHFAQRLEQDESCDNMVRSMDAQSVLPDQWRGRVQGLEDVESREDKRVWTGRDPSFGPILWIAASMF